MTRKQLLASQGPKARSPQAATGPAEAISQREDPMSDGSATERRRPLSMLRDLLDNEASGGLVLMAAAAVALLLANSPLAPAYFATLHIPIGPLGLQHWINDGLMAVFFL